MYSNSNVGDLALSLNMPGFLAGLSMLSRDPSPKVRKCVCQCIVLLIVGHMSVLKDNLAAICEFMLTALQDAEEAVAIEACDFWHHLAIGAEEEGKSVIQPYLPRIFPVMIGRLVYNEEQLKSDREEAEEEATGMKEVNLKPRHYRERGLKPDDGVEPCEQWTLRRHCAQVFDDIATELHCYKLVLPYALPVIQAHLQSVDVWVRESGLLALGALSNGCYLGMTEFLPQVWPFLLACLSDTVPELRSMACWVLGKYCRWVCQFEQVSSSTETFVQLLGALVPTMLDSSPLVQISSCTALIYLVEHVTGDSGVVVMSDGSSRRTHILTPFLETIFQHVKQAFQLYGIKSSLSLCDLLGTLATALQKVSTSGPKEGLCNSQYTHYYLPFLVQKLNEIEDDTDPQLLPIIQCLTDVAAAAQLEFQQAAYPVYTRCLKIISTAVGIQRLEQERELSAQCGAGDIYPSENDNDDDGDKDDDTANLFAYSLDCIASMAEGLEENFLHLGAAHKEQLVRSIHHCVGDQHFLVRQYGFYLTGSIFFSSVQLLLPEADRIIEAALANMDLSEDGIDFKSHNEIEKEKVCNNAIWAIGNLAMKAGAEPLTAHFEKIQHKLFQLLANEDRDCVAAYGVNMVTD